MPTPRSALAAAALAGVLLTPAAALARSDMHVTHLPTTTAGAKVPVAIYGTGAAASKHTGDKLTRGQSLMATRVSGPAHAGVQLRFTCASGFVTGYGYKGADAVALNGKLTLGRHTVRPKVQAAIDANHDGRFTGTVYAFCEGGR